MGPLSTLHGVPKYTFILSCGHKLPELDESHAPRRRVSVEGTGLVRQLVGDSWQALAPRAQGTLHLWTDAVNVPVPLPLALSTLEFKGAERADASCKAKT